MDNTESAQSAHRYQDTATGAYIGDALAMPAHWYYNTTALHQTLGRIDRYLPPPPMHPDSILWRSTYAPTDPAYDILGEQRRYWGQRGVHYHQFLSPGENTLNLKLLRLALHLVEQDGGYNRERYIAEYMKFMRAPAAHGDTYVEECHRGFFTNLQAGKKPARAAVKEKHIGGMVAVLPLYSALRHHGQSDQEARQAVHDHVSVTHGGQTIAVALDTLLTIGAELWQGARLRDVLTDHLLRQDLPYLQGPIQKQAALPPERVLGRVYSTACYLDGALPGTFYLALRYTSDPTEGIIANTMAGGDNCHRGAVLGALFALDNGISWVPESWRTGLVRGE